MRWLSTSSGRWRRSPLGPCGRRDARRVAGSGLAPACGEPAPAALECDPADEERGREQRARDQHLHGPRRHGERCSRRPSSPGASSSNAAGRGAARRRWQVRESTTAGAPNRQSSGRVSPQRSRPAPPPSRAHRQPAHHGQTGVGPARRGHRRPLGWSSSPPRSPRSRPFTSPQPVCAAPLWCWCYQLIGLIPSHPATWAPSRPPPWSAGRLRRRGRAGDRLRPRAAGPAARVAVVAGLVSLSLQDLTLADLRGRSEQSRISCSIAATRWRGPTASRGARPSLGPHGGRDVRLRAPRPRHRSPAAFDTYAHAVPAMQKEAAALIRGAGVRGTKVKRLRLH